MNSKSGYIEYYSTHGISPVTQNIVDRKRHFSRREALFRSLGLAPAYLKNQRILEFGPGSGHNAYYTASLQPALYELVEGNPVGAKDAKELLQEYTNLNFQMHHILFDQFQTEKEFDLVWAEGCLSGQEEPSTVCAAFSKFVCSGGVIALSTSSGLSTLSEQSRRLWCRLIYPQLEGEGNIHEKVEKLAPFLTPHLDNLKGMSRPVKDWIMDAIIQPRVGRKLFSFPEAIRCLEDQFDIYGSSPRFLMDWRWYKEIYKPHWRLNENALQNYYSRNLNFLDRRFEFPPQSEQFGKKLEQMGLAALNLSIRIESGDETCWQEYFELMGELSLYIGRLSPETAKAISEAIHLMKEKKFDVDQLHFPHWWGRGQQYASFIRRGDEESV